MTEEKSKLENISSEEISLENNINAFNLCKNSEEVSKRALYHSNPNPIYGPYPCNK